MTAKKVFHLFGIFASRLFHTFYFYTPGFESQFLVVRFSSSAIISFTEMILESFERLLKCIVSYFKHSRPFEALPSIGALYILFSMSVQCK